MSITCISSNLSPLTSDKKQQATGKNDQLSLKWLAIPVEEANLPKSWTVNKPTAAANAECPEGTYLIILDDLCYKITWICQVCYNWHPDTQD